MKKNLLKILPLTLLLFVVLGCSAVSQFKKSIEESQKPKVLECTDRKCQLTVPGNWKTETDLNDVANFQAGNRFAEQYAIVISDSKQDVTEEMTLDDYAELILKDFKTKVENVEQTDTKTLTISGYPAKQMEFSGVIDKIKIKWIYTFVDTPKNFHQIMAWTTFSQYESNKSVLLDVINSFKETDGIATQPAANSN